MNRGIRVLQTHALPLGYVTILKKRRLLHSKISVLSHVGAEDEARTRYLHLGKVALYQMSYSRNGASDRNRTNDTGIFSPLLYRLSYKGTCGFKGSTNPVVPKRDGDPNGARTHDLQRDRLAL